jgi:prepilin-type N-terminal cleavage/methylation domain-containing protein
MSSTFQVPSSKSDNLEPESCRLLNVEHGTWNVELPRSRAGFSLIEVMIATAILGIGIAGIVVAGSKCLAVARQARNYEVAREAVARVEIEEPIVLEEKIENAENSGTLEAPYQNFTWQRSVERVGLEEDALYEVTTIVQWSEGSDKGREEIVTFVRRPGENLPGTAAP